MAGWSPDIQVLKSDVSGLLQLVSYVKFKVKDGSGGVVLGPMKYFLLCLLFNVITNVIIND